MQPQPNLTPTRVFVFPPNILLHNQEPRFSLTHLLRKGKLFRFAIKSIEVRYRRQNNKMTFRLFSGETGIMFINKSSAERYLGKTIDSKILSEAIINYDMEAIRHDQCTKCSHVRIHDPKRYTFSGPKSLLIGVEKIPSGSFCSKCGAPIQVIYHKRSQGE